MNEDGQTQVEQSEEEFLSTPLQITTYSGTGETEVIPEGVYDCTITKLSQRIKADQFAGGQLVKGIEVTFNIDNEGPMKDHQPYNWFKPVISPQSNLRKLCVAVLGRDFIPEELAMIQKIEDLAQFIVGKPVQVIIKNRVSAKGRTYYTANDYVASPRRVLDPIAAGLKEGANKPAAPVAAAQSAPASKPLTPKADAEAPAPTAQPAPAAKAKTDEEKAEAAENVARGTFTADDLADFTDNDLAA